MATSVADAVPIPQEQHRVRVNGGLETGLFHADGDIAIANRLVAKIGRRGCNIDNFNFHDGGESKFTMIEDFIQSKRLVLWLAAATSLNDRGILEAARHIAQYASVARRDLNIRFVVLQPTEALNAKLPLSLDAYTSLREDAMFEDRLKTTVDSIRKSLNERGIEIPQQHSTASAAAVSNYLDSDFRRVPPNSDSVEEERSAVYNESGRVDLTARPEKRRRVAAGMPQSGKGTDHKADVDENQPNTTINVFNIAIHGEQNAVQIGTDAAMTMQGPVPPEPRGRNPSQKEPDDKDGTPV